MKRHRRWPFWTCAALTILLLATITASRWYQPAHYALAQRVSRYHGIQIARGALILHRVKENPNSDTTLLDFYFDAPSTEMHVTPQSTSPWVGKDKLILPLWPLALLLFLLTAWTWRRSRRPRHNHCTCGYDLTGINAHICPECAAPITPPPNRRRKPAGSP